jgi:hypothetical protein
MVGTVSTPLTISISKQFAKTPGPRYEWQGQKSGQEFLETLLKPQFLAAEKAKQKLVVDLDGTEGYSTAFLDGSFGELGREFGYDRVVASLVLITTDEPYLETEIKIYMRQSSR